MKPIYTLVFFILLLSTPILAEKSITEVMEDVDEYYYIILGENTLGGSVAAATEIVLGLLNINGVEIEKAIEGEVSDSLPKIFIATPCNEQLQEELDYNCEEWPYEEGEGIIIAKDDDIYITGTTPNDRRRAGIILNDYIGHEELSKYSFVIVQGESLEEDEISIIPGKEPSEFTCGDGVCEPGEKYLCFVDCNQQTCFQICAEQGYAKSSCREIPSNPNVEICKNNEDNKGLQYCSNERSCCCEVKSEEPNLVINNTPQEPEIITTDKEETSAKGIVATALILLGIIIVILYIMLRGQ